MGVVPQLFYFVRMEHKNTLVLTCGPEIMMRFVIYEALARRIPKDADLHLHGTQYEVRGGLLRALPVRPQLHLQAGARVQLRGGRAFLRQGGFLT